MHEKLFFFIALLASHTQGVASFLPQQRVQATTPLGRTRILEEVNQPAVSLENQKIAARIPRGGGSFSSTSLNLFPSSILPTIVANLQSGPWGILALSGVTWSVVLPLTLYKKIYGIGVAYGYSVAAAGLAMLKALSSSSNNNAAVLLARACVFYGVRLGSYLLVRDYLRDYQTTVKNGSISSRISFSATLAVFYALLTTPVLYALRSSSSAATIATTGASLAWVGAILEAVADLHKLIAKQKQQQSSEAATSDGGGDEFVGPDTWTYRICRHPNYLGEMLFWTGLFVGGVESFGRSIPAWLGSSFGLVGILSIMRKAASGLEKRQEEKYGGQERYDTWKSKVKYSLIPFVK